MNQIYHAGELQSICDELRSRGGTIGLVPTMGALHDGHGGLIRAARAECDFTVLTIFVNSLQFNNPSDLTSYPRDLEQDLAFSKSLGADFVFIPSNEEMHPEPVMFRIEVGGLSEVLEGRSRPGHFSGVATVVAKLFNLAGRCRAYFGEKDFQQVAVISRMVAEMHFPVEIVTVPTVREPSGLAMSSRNRRLSPEQLVSAASLSRALFCARRSIEEGERDPRAVERLMEEELSRHIEGIDQEDLAVLDYALVVDPLTLERPGRISGPVRLVVAAAVGDVRLIDNIGVEVPW